MHYYVMSMVKIHLIFRSKLLVNAYADCECCFRECTMNFTNPARIDPTIETYSSQLVGLSL